MLKILRIQHLVLIDLAEIFFSSGLNVLSGETGSGKSAVMEGLSLVLGERADKNIIRKGHDKAVVEAIFDIDSIIGLRQFILDSGIDYDEQDDLLIRREVMASGKSRAYVNNQPAHLTILRQIGHRVMKFLGQHANQQLFDLDQQRKILDSYAECQTLCADFFKAWNKKNSIRSQLDEWICSEAKRFRDIEICKMELEEIQEANIKVGEDEELFEEYSKLNHSEEILQHASSVVESLIGEKNSILSIMSRQRSSLERLMQLDSQLEENVSHFQQASIELQEIAYSMQNYVGRLENNPEKTAKLNERLNLIEKIKKKYGSTVEEIQLYQKNTLHRLHQMENADLKIEELQSELKYIENICNDLAVQLTSSRKRAAKVMEKEMTAHLKELNMPNAEFEIRITPQTRTATGDDAIEFYLSPNRGENQISVRQCASGGELSRLMLSLQVLLAGKEQVASLVFDEIDANIGGKTADDVGKKLRAIGNKHQVLCVTHFPQVAHYADHHLQIIKEEVGGRTVTSIHILDEATREKEIHRMAGRS